jgi:adenosylmethionine-8-amino-7-oxononanoate aminotransferase
MTQEEFSNIDKTNIWHPYSSATNALDCFCVIQAQGVYLELDNGEKVIDGMSSWWSVIHGYNNSILNAAMNQQLQKMAHVMFGGLTHTPAVELTKKLLSIVPSNLQHVFYSDSGSVAVEVAMKMAIQYWHAKEKPTKHKFATIRGVMAVVDGDFQVEVVIWRCSRHQIFIGMLHPFHTARWQHIVLKVKESGMFLVGSLSPRCPASG